MQEKAAPKGAAWNELIPPGRGPAPPWEKGVSASSAAGVEAASRGASTAARGAGARDRRHRWRGAHQWELYCNDEQVPIGMQMELAAAGLGKALGNGEPQAAALCGAVLISPNKPGGEMLGIHGDLTAGDIADADRGNPVLGGDGHVGPRPRPGHIGHSCG